jgi:hypothetical protein
MFTSLLEKLAPIENQFNINSFSFFFLNRRDHSFKLFLNPDAINFTCCYN